MSVKEFIVREVEALAPGELAKVARYVARLKQQRTPPLSPDALAALYREAADDDRALAQAGMQEYAPALAREDTA